MALNEYCHLFLKTKPKSNKYKIYDLDGVGQLTDYSIKKRDYDYPFWTLLILIDNN